MNSTKEIPYESPIVQFILCKNPKEVFFFNFPSQLICFIIQESAIVLTEAHWDSQPKRTEQLTRISWAQGSWSDRWLWKAGDPTLPPSGCGAPSSWGRNFPFCKLNSGPGDS